MIALRTSKPHPGRSPRSGWTATRIVSSVVGLLLILGSLGLLTAGGLALWSSTTQRHGGDIGLGTWTYRSTGYAVVSNTADLYGATGGLPAPQSLLGTVQIRVTPALDAGSVFVGIAPAGAASRYLTGVSYDTVRGITHYNPVYSGHTGRAPTIAPTMAGLWAACASGRGTQTLKWPVRAGDWVVAVMNADGSRSVAVRINISASLPSLSSIAAGLLVGGALVLVAGLCLCAECARRAEGHRKHKPSPWPVISED